MSEDFAAAPKVVKPKNKYKEMETEEQEEEEIKLIYNNLMWDKRIVRGNTYSAIVTSKNVEVPYANRTNQPKLKLESDETMELSNKRTNIQIFTDEYVETLTDKPPKYEYGAQTQWKIQKTIIRHMIPIPTGTTRQTQIWDHQLFDFDYEVQPLLRVLCGRTLQIGRMQVLQEEQLRVMRDRQKQLHLEEERENKKIQDMYALEEKLEMENAKRLQNIRKEKQKNKKSHKRLFSRVMAKQYLKDIRNNTLQVVQANGYFRNPIEDQLVRVVLPAFYAESLNLLNQESRILQETLDVSEQAKLIIMKQHAWAREVERTRRQKIIHKREEMAREKKERKQMFGEENRMIKFISDEKIKIQEQLQAAKKAAQLLEGEKEKQEN